MTFAIPTAGEPAGQIDTREIATAVVLDWRPAAALTALRMGLSSRAAALYEQVIAELPSGSAQNHHVQLAIAYLQMGQNSRAREVLTSIDAAIANERSALYLLIANYRLNSIATLSDMRAHLTKIDPDALDTFDLPWYFLLQMLAAEVADRQDDAAEALKRARETATESGQDKLFEALILREEMRRTVANETQLLNLQTRLQAASGEAAAFPFVRQFAIALHTAGRPQDAIAAIDQQLAAAVDFGTRERDQLLLLKGMILGSDTADGRAAFRELIRSGGNRESMGIALQLLAMQARPETPESANLASFLDELVTRSEPHPLLGEVYLIRAQLSLDRNDIALAEEDAEILLERFPGLDSIHRAYHVLGLAALRRTPSQYRTAANYFQQYRDAVELPALRQHLAILIGDCYFLNQDYNNAAEYYRSAWQAASGDLPLPPIFLRLISAHLRANEVDDALIWLNDPAVRVRISPLALWRAEWNVSRHLTAHNRAAEAAERIDLQLADIPESDSDLAGLRLRLLWLSIRIAQSLTSETVSTSALQQLLDGVEALDEGEEKTILQAETLLLQSEILLQSGSTESARSVLQTLREGFAGTTSSDRSYFTEAAFLSQRGEIAAAQERLLGFSVEFPQSPLAPQALFDSAVLAEQLGPDLYREALQRMDRLADQYPDSPLVFLARLRQGELLRRLGDFPSAQSVYETLLARFPEHPMRYAAELGRADSLLALSRSDPNALADIQQSLERMLDLPRISASIRAEVLYKQAHIFMQREQPEQAIHILSRLLGDFLSAETGEPAVTDLDENGRYWLARGLLDLGSLLESKGQLREARRTWLMLERMRLPGSQLARNRADALRITDAD